MRAKPDLWKGTDRIQWGCVLMRLLGESSLETLSVVLSGLRAVEHSRHRWHHIRSQCVRRECFSETY